ncbi:exostosin domain-containing protein [Granulosicoccus sp. 3-233]|uniref:exostosin domain-containing protein n=1 Tax=Granulosicoccus sp. 3-233 TaxID=3417969 RepID=UPI003D3398FA
MKLHLTSAYDTHTGLDALTGVALLDRVGEHELCADPAEADAILFVENTHFDDLLFRQLLQHVLVADYPDKVYMYNEMDRPWDVLPGLYCCLTRRHHDPTRHRPFAYLYSPNPYVSNIYSSDRETRYLFSFMGSMSHGCRRTIMQLQHRDALLRDTSDFNVWDSEPAEMQVRGREYASTLAASRFVLCPRGIGTSSIRLYETLEAGRVPVIISDQWAPPPETDWSFAIQVEERRIRSIPGLLSAMEGEADNRGQEARQAWLDNYAPDTLFNTVGNSLASLIDSGHGSRHRRPGTQLNKWLAGGELLKRTAAQRLLGNQ